MYTFFHSGEHIHLAIQPTNAADGSVIPRGNAAS